MARRRAQRQHPERVKTAFTQILDQLLIDNHWTVEELAQRIGVSRSTVERWFDASQRPRIGVLRVIADLDGVSRQELFRAVGRPDPGDNGTAAHAPPGTATSATHAGGSDAHDHVLAMIRASGLPRHVIEALIRQEVADREARIAGVHRVIDEMRRLYGATPDGSVNDGATMAMRDPGA
jgi:transcriptional regulator with XRE-family HTH domain